MLPQPMAWAGQVLGSQRAVVDRQVAGIHIRLQFVDPALQLLCDQQGLDASRRYPAQGRKESVGSHPQLGKDLIHQLANPRVPGR